MKDRVRSSSSGKVNYEVDQNTMEHIDHFMAQDDAVITNRIVALEREWDIERALEVNMPIVAMIGLALGVFINPWWLLFTALVLLFFLQHAIQGWCPPLPVFRKLGYRTRKEIEKEKYALKLIRGDFNTVLNERYAEPTAIYRAVSRT